MRFVEDLADALKMWNDVNPFVRCMLALLYFVSYGVPPSLGFIMFASISALSIVVAMFEYVRITEKKGLYA